jgi:threonine dehydratase
MLQLREQLAGKRIGVLVCGSNVDHATFGKCLERGAPA